MQYDEENENFVNQVVEDLLDIPNLQQDVNPVLTKELKEKFQKAGERFTQILASFNALPGVKAEKYDSDASPNILFQIDIPVTSFFLLNQEAYAEQTTEMVCLNVGFRNIRAICSDAGQHGKSDVSDIFKEWHNTYFLKYEGNQWSGHLNGAELISTQMTIPELYAAVQKLIASYMEALDE